MFRAGSVELEIAELYTSMVLEGVKSFSNK